MQKTRIRNNKNKKVKSLIFLGSLFIIISISMIFINKCIYSKNINQEKEAIDNFYEQEEKVIIKPINEEIPKEEIKPVVAPPKPKVNYIGVLRIPKINLKQGLVNRNSYLNNIKYNIMIHKDSSIPEEKNGNVILVAHSGTAYVSYFRKLNNVVLDDLIYLDCHGKTFTYKVTKKYEVNKTGVVEIHRNMNASTITLITCKNNSNKQIVVIGEMI